MVKTLTVLLCLGCGYHRLEKTPNITISLKLNSRRNLKLILLYRSLSPSATQILDNYIYTSNLNRFMTVSWLRHRYCPVHTAAAPFHLSPPIQEVGTPYREWSQAHTLPILIPKPCPGSASWRELKACQRLL